MDVRKKSKEELENQVAGFLEYEKGKGKIDEKRSKELFDILLNNEKIIASKEETQKQLMGVLTSEEFNGLYEDYRKWLEKTNKLKKDIIEKVLPKEYMFLSNENYLKNYFLMQESKNVNIEHYRNLIEKNIRILKKYNIKNKNLKLFIELILFHSSEFIDKNLKLFYDNGITDIGDLCLLKNGMTWRSDWKEENIKSLNMLGITESKDLVKLKEIILSKNPELTRINLEILKNVGITRVEDLVELQDILIAGHKYSILRGPLGKIVRNDTSENISECLKLLINAGIVSVNDLKILKRIILSGNFNCLKIIINCEIINPSDLKSIEDLIIYGNSKILEILNNFNLIKNLDDLKLLCDIIENGNYVILEIFITLGIKKLEDLVKLKDVIISFTKPENIKRNIQALKESGIIEIDDLVKLKDVIISFTKPENIKRNIQALKESGIIEIDDLVKFQDVIKCDIDDDVRPIPINTVKRKIKDNIQALKESGIIEIDDLVKFQDVILEYRSSTIYRKTNSLKEKFSVLRDMGITDVDDLLSFGDIIYNYTYNVRKIKKEFDILFYEWKIQSSKELSKFQQAVLYENISKFKKYFGSIKNDEILDSEMKVLTRINLPENLEFREKNHKGYLNFIAKIVDTGYNDHKKSKMIKKIVTLGFDEAEKYLEIFEIFDTSISMDVQRVKNELIDEVLESKNPLEITKQIKKIFEKNNLPLIGKIFKVFELLYPEDKFKSKLKPTSGVGILGSPILNNYIEKGESVYKLIYKDLMNIAIKSGDRSLKRYLKTFIGSEKLLKKFEGILLEKGFNPDDEQCLKGLSLQEKEELFYLFQKISVLYSRYFGKGIEEGNLVGGKSLLSDKELFGIYDKIKRGFNLREGKSLYDRLKVLLHVNGLKYHSPEEVLEQMYKSKRAAHERGLKLYNESIGGKIDFPKHAFLKGVDEYAFSEIINRGVTSREYLGGGVNGDAAGSDSTPFDIDGWYTDSFLEGSYGCVNLVVDTEKNNVFDTGEAGITGYDENRYELFRTGALGENHYGVRTGIPTTEVDYIIYTGNFESKEFGAICYGIAKNGYYVPITDKNGYVKFTPEMYHIIRAGFNFMEYYDGYDVELKNGKYVSCESDVKVNKSYNGENEEIRNEELGKLIEENSPSNDKYKTFAKENKELAGNTIERIKRILEEKCGIKFNSKYDSSITGAEIHDSGSTGRGTDIPTKDVDLDFTLILDEKDYERVNEISKIIHEAIGTQKDDDHGVVEGGNQIKSKINNIGKSARRPNGVPLDLLILKKSQVIDYSSSDAMKEKLEYIAKNSKNGVEDLDRVRTNVIIMKKLLKAKCCYKKPEGGISGIGVENRITQCHGSFIEALESFEQIAYGGIYEPLKQPLPLKKFQECYPIYDAGENYKDGGNDNFVHKLKENGYIGILEIAKVLRLEGIKGIRKLINEYEEQKAEFIG